MEVRGLILRAAFYGPATASASMYLQVAPQRPRLLVTTSTRHPTVSVCMLSHVTRDSALSRSAATPSST